MSDNLAVSAWSHVSLYKNSGGPAVVHVILHAAKNQLLIHMSVATWIWLGYLKATPTTYFVLSSTPEEVAHIKNSTHTNNHL